jgi:hypothetical protein
MRDCSAQGFMTVIVRQAVILVGGRARRAVQDFPCPVRIPIRFGDAEISSSNHRPAMLRIMAWTSRQPCSPLLGLRTRS